MADTNISDGFVVKKDAVDFVISFATQIAPQMIIAFLVMIMIDDGWKVFWLSLVIVNLYHFYLWLMNTLITSFTFKYYFLKRLSDSILSCLELFDFPAVSDRVLCLEKSPYFSPEDFYYHCYMSKNLPCKVRIKAAAYCGEYKEATENGKIILRKRMNKVHWDALKRYAQKYPDRVPEQDNEHEQQSEL